jgi:hypothetical protein
MNLRKALMVITPTLVTLGVLKMGRDLPVIRQVRNFVL